MQRQLCFGTNIIIGFDLIDSISLLFFTNTHFSHLMSISSLRGNSSNVIDMFIHVIV